MGKGSQTQKTESAPWKPAQSHLKNIMGTASDYFSDGTFTVDPYSGSRVAALSDQTMSGVEALSTPTGVAPASMEAWQSMLNPTGYTDQLAAIKSGIVDDTKANLAGMFSGGRAGNSLAAPAAAKAMTNALAGHEYGALQDMENRKMQALSMAPSMQNLATSDAMNAINAGGILDNYNQNVINADMAKHYELENMDADALSRYSAFATGIGGLGGTSSSTATQQAGLGSILGTGLQVVGMLSDRRAKEDIEKIGETFSGTAIYKFRYKGKPKVHIGVMADEVPEAVIGKVDGFNVVDYGRVS